MKKIIMAVAIILGGFSAVQAQAPKKEVNKTVLTDTLQVDYKTRYISSFWDNFYIEADFAGRMLMGEDDSHLSFGKRLKPGFGITVGKWLHPDFGVRLNFGGSRLKGWNSGATGIYAYKDSWIDDFDPVREYWDSKGRDTKNGYRQDLKYYELNADFLFDLYNVFTPNNRLNRKWTAQGYVGIGMLRAAKYHGMEDNIKTGFRFGLIGNYNITNRWGIHMSLGSEITNSSFDGELGKGRKFAGILSGSVGISFRIGRQGYKVVRLVPEEQLAALNHAVTLIRSEQTIAGDTIEVIKKRMDIGSLLTPSVVFYPGRNEFNEELQMVNIFHIAHYMMRYEDAKIAIVGNTGGTDKHLAHQRAEKVRDLLVNKYGIFPERMEIQAYDMNDKYGVTGYDQSVNFTIVK
ncbi:hypothetical protein [uncultured Parabacteroides sp.]|uniref:hypothetical protein n=1 Tax=uncultured Parabacteroides sp. TaxID=512312 RepID=UPI00260A9056|nr:hypothetical protein [uncultured Parabacteroides sp.]